MRKVFSFNNDYQFLKPGSAPENVSLPHTWNAVDGQDGGNDYYRGTCTYEKRFSKPELAPGERVFLEVHGAAMTSEVILNSVKLCRHEGGYSTFRVELTGALAEENVLSILVNNEDNTIVYPQKADFTFYGGLYRDVNLIVVPEVHFELVKDGTPGIKVTPIVDLAKKSATVTVETWQNGGSVTFTVNGETKTAPSVDDHAAAKFVIENVHLWDGLDDPFLYTATAKLDSGDEISTRFGCRQFDFDSQKGFFLNGRSYPLRGVSRHQDLKNKGNAISLDDHKADMAIIREIGANTLRLAHYQHAQEFYDMCDENGLVVWAEIPYITMHMKTGRENTLSQMRELITQSYNHPSIAVWGLSNEITAASVVDEDLLENHRLLNDLCHKLDLTRKTTMANVFMLETDSPILDISDINSYNLYYGWYLGELSDNDEFFDEFHAKYPDKVMGFSEYGADANPAFHSSCPEKGDYTEEYQCVYHEHMQQMIEERPWLWATHVWNLFDFAADGRDEGGKCGENQKGLVTIDRKVKKDAFYLYKAAWNKTEPFVHICGRRYVDRCGEVAEIKVYSNQPVVTLMMDGMTVATQSGKTVFTFGVTLTGEHMISAKAGSCTDTISIRKADAPNPNYALAQKEEVVNWFDKEDIKPDYFSIKDPLGALRQHPEAGKIADGLLAKARASRGDVAQSVSANNPALERMMASMTLEQMIKRAGGVISEAEAKQVNELLQKIKK